MKLILSTVAVMCSLGALAAQAPQAPPVTPMKFAHYPATELKAPRHHSEERRPDHLETPA